MGEMMVLPRSGNGGADALFLPAEWGRRDGGDGAGETPEMKEMKRS
jgi:hypothetical protein